MANTQTGAPTDGALPTFEAQPISSTGSTSYSVPDGNSGTIAAAGFDKITKTANEWGEQAARDEATTAGQVAGLDPSYRPDSSETLRGQAFRAAAVATYGNQLEAKVRQTTGQIWNDYIALPADQRDPAALTSTLDAARKSMLDPKTGDVFPQVQPHFEQAWSQYTQAYAKGATDDFDRRSLDAAGAAAIQNQNASAEKSLQLASIPNQDPAMIDREVAAFGKIVDDRVNGGQITAVQAERLKEAHLQQVNLTKALANFSGLPDADKAAALEKFRTDYGYQSLGGAPPAVAIANAIHMQESGGRANSPTSVDGAQGGWQITAPTFKQFAQPGERIDNAADNERVGRRMIAKYAADYANDPARVAVAYFSGPGNVSAPGSPTPWKGDLADGNGTTTSSYVAGVQRRMGQPNLAAGLTNSSFDWLNGKLGQQVAAIQSNAETAQRGALREIGAAQKQITSGYDLPDAAWSQLQSKYAASADPAVNAAFAQASQIRGMIQHFVGQPPAAVETQVANLEAGLAHGATPQQQQVVEAAQGFLTKYRSDIANNPVGRYARDFGARVPPIDASSPESLAASLAARAPIAEQAAKQYGLAQPVYLQPDERAAFKSIAAAGGPRMVQTAGAMMSALGQSGDAVLKEIQGDAPKFATAARLASWSGDPGFLADFAERQRLAADPTMSKALELPSRNASDTALKGVLGQSMASMPGMNAATRQAAIQVYELRALREGYDRSVSDSASTAALAKAAQQAAGATYQGDVQYGGVGAAPGAHGWLWNGSDRVLAPLNLRADRVGDAIGALTDADIKAMPEAPVYGDGRTAVPLRVLQGARYVSVGHGRYQVALGDPMGATPNFVVTPGGGRWTLDLNRVEPQLRQRMPPGSWK